MKINHVVIHELVKVQHEKIEKSKIKKQTLDRTHPAVTKTVENVVSAYATKKNGAHYGIFKTGEGRGCFPDSFEAYASIGSVSSKEEFIALTKTVMNELYREASNKSASSGGYLIFADYERESVRFFMVAMVKLKEGITLTEELKPEELMHLDLSRLNQAARINFTRITEYLAADEDKRFELSNYLSFVSPGATKAASGYFVQALGCAPGTAAAQATTTLVKESRAFFLKNDYLKPVASRFRSKLISFLREKAEKKLSVSLPEVGEIARAFIPLKLAEDADDLVSDLIGYLNSERCSVPVEFPVSKVSVEKLTHIRGSADTWDISFDKSALGLTDKADVYYNQKDEKIILSNIPDKLKEQILLALQPDKTEE